MSPVEIRIARPDDYARAQAAYEAWGYKRRIRPDDTVFVAERGGELVGVVRMTREEGTRMLRGMQVAPSAQQQGVGTRLLHALVAELGGEACYCVPYTHLLGFYGQVGFVEAPLADAPAFLKERVAQYRSEGLDVTLMRRPGALEGASAPVSASAR